MDKHSPLTLFFFDRIVLQYPRTVLLCVLIAAGFLGFEARKFRLDASAETLVLQNDKDLQYARLISSRFGESDFLVLTYTPKADLFSQESLDTLARLRDDLESLKHIQSVLTILDVPLLENPPVSLKELSADLPTITSPGVDTQRAAMELRTSPFCKDLLLSDDGQTTALLITLGDGEAAEQPDKIEQQKASASEPATEQAGLMHKTEQVRKERDEARQRRHQGIVAIRDVAKEYRGNAELFLGGVSMIADDMITFIKNDLKVFGVGVLLFLVIMLGIIFRRIRWIGLPLLCCVVSVICMMGLLGWFGWDVTVISSNFISLQLIITMAITIHLIVRYRELLVQNPQADNRILIRDTVVEKLRPCVYTVLTTIAGFGSLVLSNILPVISFGWMMIAGLIVSLIVTFLLFPSVLMSIPKEARLVLIFSLLGISRLQVENCFIDYFGKKTEIYQGMKVIDQRLGGTTPFDVIADFGAVNDPPATPSAADENDVFDEFTDFDKAATGEKYWFTAEKMRRIEAVHHYLESLPQTGKVLSLATLLSIAEKLNKGKPLDSVELALLFNQTPLRLKKLLVNPFVSVGHNEVRFWVRVIDSDKTLRRNMLLETVKDDLTGPGAPGGFGKDHIHLAGMLVLYNNMLQKLFGSQILTLGFTAAALTAMFLVLFGSMRIALIAMFSNVLPILLVLGIMGWLGMPLDMMTITIAAIGLGIAVTIIIGFSILAMSNFKPTVYFGLLTGLAMTVALLAALTLMPELLLLTRPFGKEA
ncbi:MAG: MMPL family transporter [Sedimentisphaerales bacterium]